MSNDITPRGSVEILPPQHNQGPISTVLDASRHGFRILGRKADQSTGVVMQWLLLAGGAIWLYYNMDDIKTFMQDAVATGTAAVKLTAIGAILAVSWYVLTRPALYRLVAQIIDSTLDRVHMWWIDRDKFGAAQYAIKQLRKEVGVAEQAKGVLQGTSGKAEERINQHRGAAQEALDGARGLMQEIKRREAGTNARSISPNVAKMTDTQLQNALSLKKSQLRSHSDFFKSEMQRKARYDGDIKKIDVIIDAVTARITKLETDLSIETERWENEKESLIASQATAQVLDSQAYRDYEHALTGIKNEAFAMQGQARRYMDQLDPTVKAYQADMAVSDIADDQFFNQFAADLGLDAGDVKTKLLPAATETSEELPGIDEVLGGTQARVATPVPVNRRSNVDELLSRRKH